MFYCAASNFMLMGYIQGINMLFMSVMCNGLNPGQQRRCLKTQTDILSWENMIYSYGEAGDAL